MPSVAIHLKLAQPWPPAQKMRIFGKSVEDYQVELWGDDKGRFEFVAASASLSHHYLSQPIESGGGALVIVWDSSPHSVRMRMNAIDLAEDAESIPTIHFPRPNLGSGIVSTESPDAYTRCKSWIEKRRAKFSQLPTPRPAQRLKTINEEASDLRDALSAMRDLRRWVDAGNLYHLPGLGGKLRALTYWKNDTKRDNNYDPLLLRMAGKADLPLPVYLPKIVPIPPIVESADEHFIPHVPSLTKTFAAEEIGDFQQWLTGSAMRVAKLGKEAVPVKEFLARISMTIGDSHFDPQVNLYVEVIQQMQLYRGHQLTIFICQTVDIVSSLGNWVLAELRGRRIIA